MVVVVVELEKNSRDAWEREMRTFDPLLDIEEARKGIGKRQGGVKDQGLAQMKRKIIYP